MNVTRHLLLGPAFMLALTACSLTPAYERPNVTVPVQWDEIASSRHVSVGGDAERIKDDWWTRFESDELNQLMSEALAFNHDVAAATARIAQARASAMGARSRLIPDVTVSVAATRDRQTGNGRAISTTSDETALTVGYELDLWGGSLAGTYAAKARVAASQYDRDALRLVLQAEVASTYFQALAIKDRLAIAQSNLQSARQLMSLVETRFKYGGVSGLDVAQQRTTLLGIEADVPALAQELNETQNALAILIGRPPQGFRIQGESLNELELPTINAGQPAELLERRPDIRSAEASLIAANADIGAARAALFPGLSISASATTGWLTGNGGTLTSLAGQLMQVLFDGGSLRADVAFNKAARQELVEIYAQTWLDSLQEVQDSLYAISNAHIRAILLEQMAGEAREAYRLAAVRYQAGSDDLLSLLTSQQSLLNAEDSLKQAQLTIYSATSNLFKALGGGWDPVIT
jgi:outer membrane protein, multidrug efflux system